MSEPEKTERGGELIISEDVIASIAANAARDVEGVSSLASRPNDLSILFKGDKPGKSVRVWNGDNDVKIQMYINIKSSANIPTVASAVQRSVKNAVQGMTGKVVTRVNVNIAGADFEG
ncbi:MAG: Asp23/Gls24 family envelope stress response protein [Clostridiales bacterium]|nr:Asp23/Gls24 family envelope stress response protein [Clostridiales bacterium]